MNTNPDPHPVLTSKLAALRSSDPELYLMITGRDPLTDQPVTKGTP